MVNNVYFIVIQICKENMEAWFFTYSLNEIYISYVGWFSIKLLSNFILR